MYWSGARRWLGLTQGSSPQKEALTPHARLSTDSDVCTYMYLFMYSVCGPRWLSWTKSGIARECTAHAAETRTGEAYLYVHLFRFIFMCLCLKFAGEDGWVEQGLLLTRECTACAAQTGTSEAHLYLFIYCVAETGTGEACSHLFQYVFVCFRIKFAGEDGWVGWPVESARECTTYVAKTGTGKAYLYIHFYTLLYGYVFSLRAKMVELDNEWRALETAG